MSDFRDRINKLTPKQLAYLALQLQERLAEAVAAEHEPVAIIGIGCRFPGAESPEAFWELLSEGRDAISEVPPERWNIDDYFDPDPDAPGKMSTRFGGFLSGVDRFDPECFGISPREALTMDPQQRLLLEVGWEALEHAGVSTDALRGSHAGIFVGMSSTDFSANMMSSGRHDMLDVHFSTGNARSVAAGRLSYVLGLHGPSVCIDTACSSSLVAVHLACQSLRTRDCDLALAGGVNLILSPGITIALSKAHMMAPDGRCKAFDASGDGFVRGEGCGLVVLQRLHDALEARANIVAVIRGSSSNQDGRSSGITAPNGLAQEDVIRRALAACGEGVDPGDVAFVEAHGTGTELGDPIEVRALNATYGAGRTPDRALAIGSVKTNIGHLESAAGAAGLIKAALCVKHGEIPANLHLTRLNPHIEWDEMPFTVPTKHSVWPAVFDKRMAAVSSFGFSGTNAHVVLEEAPEPVEEEPPESAHERPIHVLPLSAHTESALGALCDRFAESLARGDHRLADVCFTAATGRGHHAHRAAVVASSAEDAAALLRGMRDGDTPPRSRRGRVAAKGNADVVFLFTGQGSQYPGMGRQLFDTEPAFRATLEACDEALRPHLDEPLLSVMYPGPGRESFLDRTGYTQPALFALEYALAQLWRSWGIEPTAAMGHSLGEYVAACLAGVFDLEDALKLVAARARLMQALPEGGGMVALTAGEERVCAALKALGGEVSLAATNGPDSVVVSGPIPALDAVVEQLEGEGVRARRLAVSHAFHSSLMEPMLEEFGRVAQQISYSPPRFRVVSNVTGAMASGTDLRDAEYWKRHVRSTVRFAEGMRTLGDRGYSRFVEIGPKPTLLGMAMECLPGGGRLWLPTLRAGQDDWVQMLDSLAALYVAGADVAWEGLDRAARRHRVVLPTYPFQRERYWPEAASIHPPTAPHGPAPEDADNWVYEVAWRTEPEAARRAADVLPEIEPIAAKLLSRMAGLAADNQLEAYGEHVPIIDELCLGYILAALRGLGWNPKVGERLTAGALKRELGIVDDHARLVGRFIVILSEARIIEERGEEWQVRADLPEVPTGDLHDALLEKMPAHEAELALLGRCGEALADVLRGADALQVLFPGGSLTTTEQVYGDAPIARVYNTLIADGIEEVVAGIPADRTVKILEIGGGTGGTTSHLLPRLPPDRTDYCFTDVSRLFTARAEEKFADFPFVRFRLLDIEQDPAVQQFSYGEFDIVVAANVLHATSELRTTLRRVRRLLAPGGLLVLLEATSPQRFSDLTVGLTEGWWAFADSELRSSYALLDREQWHDLLRSEGFGDIVAIPNVGSQVEPWAQQAVLFARVPCADTAATAEAAEGRDWVVFEAGGRLGEAVGRALRERGDRAVIVSQGAAFEACGEDAFTVNPSRREDFERLLGEAVSDELAGVIYLWALDTPPPDGHSGAEVVDAQSIACSGALHLIQAIAGSPELASADLWLVTRGAQPAGDAAEPVVFQQAPLLGMAKVVALEHPELRCRRLDLDPAAGDSAEALLAAIEADPNADQIAVRNGERRVARLARVPPESLGPEVAELFRDDTTHLITGAFGGLGLPLAAWMVEHGARHLVMTGRRDPGEDVSAAIERLRASGADVLVARADVARRVDLEKLLDEVAGSMPDLRGVFHLAGKLNDGVLMQQSWDRFADVMASKVAGSWNLHELTRHLPLDHFVLFSTGASLIGSPGQGNHAAANAFMDALAVHRRARGLAGLSVNWGAWADVGAAVEHRLSEAVAFRMMPPDAALRCFGRLLRGDRAQVGVIDVNWSAAAGRRYADIPFLEEVLREAGTAKAPTRSSEESLREALEAAIPSRRRELLLGRIAREAATVLGIDGSRRLDADRPLQELGLDSLMAVELRNTLGEVVESELPATLLFDHPTLDNLVDYIAREVLDSAGLEPDADLTADDDDLTEDELEELLASKLQTIDDERGP